MTRDDIIRLAEEAGVPMERGIINGITYCRFHPAIERFANFVAAAEREACALIAESYEPRCDTCPSGVTNAIRARGA
jgi:hypothetical protein